MTEGIRNSASYFNVLARTLRSVSSQTVDQIAAELLHAYCNDRTIFVFGNGGSAATASHFACDLGKGATKWLPSDARRFRVIALTDNVPLISAWANDSNYDEVFTEQLRNLLRPGDLSIAISSSGDSPNVLSALKLSQQCGATTIGFSGFNGGLMRQLCHHCLIVPSDNVEVIEDLHLAVCHSLSTLVRSALLEIVPSDFVSLSRPVSPSPLSPCSKSRTNQPRVLEMTASGVALNQFTSMGKTGTPITQGHADAD